MPTQRVHHIGVKMPDSKSYELAVSALATAGLIAVQADALDASGKLDHRRTYFPLKDADNENTRIWLEIQCFEDGKFGVHVDMIAWPTGEAASEVCKITGKERIFLDGEPQVIAPITGPFSIMFRSPIGGHWIPGA